jgi:hypothetical protein
VTTKDKTGDQLMASIRKTKTEGASADKTSGSMPPSAPPAAAKTAAPSSKPAATTAKPPRATKKKVVAKPGPKPAARSEPASAYAGYQSSGRVWPD